MQIPRLFLVVLLAAGVAGAQTATQWQAVKALSSGTLLTVRATDRPNTRCRFETADDDQLKCTSHRLIFVVPITRNLTIRRADVKSVRLSRQPLSTIAGAAIGAGAGIAIGAVMDARAKSNEDPNLATVLLGFVGGLIGTAVGGGSDFLGKAIYKAP